MNCLDSNLTPASAANHFFLRILKSMFTVTQTVGYQNCVLLMFVFCRKVNWPLVLLKQNTSSKNYFKENVKVKSKGIPRQAEVTLGVPGRLRHRIFSTFGTTRVLGRQPKAPAAFNPGEIPGTHFQRLSRPQGTWFCRKEPRKKSQVTPPGIDPGTIWLVAQRLNHYATPGPFKENGSSLSLEIVIGYK